MKLYTAEIHLHRTCVLSSATSPSWPKIARSPSSGDTGAARKSRKAPSPQPRLGSVDPQTENSSQRSKGGGAAVGGHQRSPVIVCGLKMIGRALEDDDDFSDEIDFTLIDWFLTLSPWERLQASANWARLAALGRADSEDE
jgi:hypothetical protein